MIASEFWLNYRTWLEFELLKSRQRLTELNKHEKLMKVIELIDSPSENIISEEEWLKNGKLANRFK